MLKSKTTLWQEFSRRIRQRDASHEGYVACVSCGKTFPWQETDCGHFVENTERSKGWGGNALWYDERNFAAQCIACNRFKAAEAKRNWGVTFASKYGKELHEELISLKNTPKKWTPEEVNEILDNIDVNSEPFV
jgi:hypothetical protein